MTRKEEIRNASVAYNEKCGKFLVIGGDGILSEEEYLEFNKNPSFIAGAEWGDRTMSDKACEWLDRYFENKVFKTQRESIINDFKKYMEE